MGWSIPWVSSAGSDFNLDLGFSSTKAQTREWVTPMLEQLPPIAGRKASETGTPRPSRRGGRGETRPTRRGCRRR